jgi:dTDP-4-amino-4,6-dideoxygalactose transaminase
MTPTTVRFLDLRAPYEELREELDEAVGRVLASGWFILGEEVTSFEHEFAAYCGADHCVGVNSGLDAIHVALRALGVGPGDEVLVPAHTFVATWLGVTHAGATPVPVGVDDSTYNLDPAQVEEVLTERTRAIVPVHLYGQTADMDPIMALATHHGLAVLEDAAQAHGAEYRGSRAGALGHVAAFSFYPGKNLGAMGDAGAIVTDDVELAERCRMLRNYGSRRKYHHELAGHNTRLDELQAAVLRVKLRHLDAWNARRRALAHRYHDALQFPELVLPAVTAESAHVWHLFVVRHPQRDALIEAIARRGVDTLIHYPVPPHVAPAYREATPCGNGHAQAERLAGEVLSLPIGPHLGEAESVRAIHAVRAAVDEVSGL